MVLVGKNKGERSVAKSDAETLARLHRIKYFEYSEDDYNSEFLEEILTEVYEKQFK